MNKIIFTIIVVSLLIIPGFANSQIGNDFPLDVVWSTNTYVSPGLGVKALPTLGSIITVAALTPTRNSNVIDFSWVVEDSLYLGQGPAQKGVGEDTFAFVTKPYIPGFIYKLRIIARDTSTGAEATTVVEIPTQDPETHLYLGSGPFSRRVANRLVVTPGARGNVFVKPFYFNVQNLNDIVFSWVFNGQETSPGETPNSLEISVSSNSATGIEQTLLLRAQNIINDRESSRTRASLLVLPAQ